MQTCELKVTLVPLSVVSWNWVKKLCSFC